jgi:hypothetical protein
MGDYRGIVYSLEEVSERLGVEATYLEAKLSEAMEHKPIYTLVDEKFRILRDNIYDTLLVSPRVKYVWLVEKKKE